MLHYLPIVYVEDHEENFARFQVALAQTKHQGKMMHFSCAKEAEKFFQEAKIQGLNLGIILVDLHLPDRAGVELIRTIRQEEKFRNLPLIGIAEEYVFEDVESSYEAGANLFLIKPKDARGWADLVFRVEEYFSPRR